MWHNGTGVKLPGEQGTSEEHERTEHQLQNERGHAHGMLVFVAAAEDQIPHGFPTIDMGPQLKVVERTRTATMLCAASGNPDPEIFWFKDFLPVDISSSNGRIKQLRSGTVLVQNA